MVRYSLSCPLLLGLIIVAIPRYTQGQLPLVPKKKDDRPLSSRVDALELPRQNPGHLLPPPGTTDVESIARIEGNTATQEIKECHAVMDHHRCLPVAAEGGMPVNQVDERAAEVRAIQLGSMRLP